MPNDLQYKDWEYKMKITKRQLRKMINEMYPAQGITLASLEKLTMTHQNLMRDIEELYLEAGLPLGETDDLADQFTELLLPLFVHAEGGSGAPSR